TGSSRRRSCRRSTRSSTTSLCADGDGVAPFREKLLRLQSKETGMKPLLGVLIAALAVCSAGAAAQEKIKYGSSVRLAPPYYLPVLAAEERGIFKKNGVNVEWFPSNSGTDMQRALAADAVNIGSSSAGADIPSMGRGVPISIVANLQSTDDFAVWVSTKAKRDKVADLK